MSVYTVIVEYAGGTYIGQVNVPHVSLAALAWLQKQPDELFDLWKIVRERSAYCSQLSLRLLSAICETSGA